MLLLLACFAAAMQNPLLLWKPSEEAGQDSAVQLQQLLRSTALCAVQRRRRLAYLFFFFFFFFFFFCLCYTSRDSPSLRGFVCVARRMLVADCNSMQAALSCIMSFQGRCVGAVCSIVVHGSSCTAGQFAASWMWADGFAMIAHSMTTGFTVVCLWF
jgi:hypothetical protein